MGLISVIFMGMILRIVLMAGWSHMMRQRSTNRIAKVEWQRVTSSKSMILIRDSAEAARIREKYPNRIPVIVEKAERSDIPNIDKKKFFDKLNDRVEDRQLDSTRVEEVLLFHIISISRFLRGKAPLRSSKSFSGCIDYGGEGDDHLYRSKRTVLEVLRELDADILALQDVKAKEEKY